MSFESTDNNSGFDIGVAIKTARSATNNNDAQINAAVIFITKLPLRDFPFESDK